VTLSTIHKAKGREWPKVFLLGRNRYMPSKYATQDWQLDQEKNLIYVAVTRAQEELIEVRVPLPNEQPTAEAVVEWKTTQLAAQRPGLIEAPRFDEQASKALRMAAAQPQIADEQVVHDAVLLPRPSLPDVNPLLVKALMQQKGLTFGEALRQVVEAMEGA
jgi:ATP-dependent exoDNAse (exonuclease V) beta subunit